MNIRIPQALGSLVAAAALLGAARADTVLLSEAAYPEGPMWRDGKLLYVEYAGPGIKMWDGRHAVPYWSSEHCGASGLIASAQTKGGERTWRLRRGNSAPGAEM